MQHFSNPVFFLKNSDNTLIFMNARQDENLFIYFPYSIIKPKYSTNQYKPHLILKPIVTD